MIFMIKDKLKNLLSTDGSLQQKTIKSGFWSFASRISTRGLSILKIIIVARLLSPNDFGLLGIAILTLAIFEVFSKTGFKESIIQNKEKIDDYLNTAWTTLALRGFALYGIVFVSAPYIATFFNEPRAELIIRVIGLTLIFNGLQNIGVILFQKDLEFHKNFALDLSSAVPAFILTVFLAYAWRNVWALIYGGLLGSVCLLVTSFLIHGHRPKPEFKKDKATQMFGFGKWVLGSSIIIFLLTQGDDIFVGRFLGVTALGIYILAYRVSNLPATEISHVIQRVAFPSFSKMQDNKEKLKLVYIKLLQLLSFIVFPLGALIYVLINNFTITILGIQWVPIIPIVMVFVFQTANRAIGGTLTSISTALGRPDIQTRISTVQLIILVILIYPMSLYLGVLGVAIVVLIESTISIPIALKLVLPQINMRLKEFAKALRTPFILMIFMVIPLFLITKMMSFGIYTLILQGGIGIGLYIILFFVFLRLDLFETKELSREFKRVKTNIVSGGNK